MDMSAAAIKTYLQTLQDDLRRGYASEHTHRPAFKVLLESLGEQVAATNEPRQVTACGKPDMVVSRGPVVLGYVETKDVNANLDVEEKSPQLQRYRDGLANLLLTNYLECRWYVNGELRGQALLGRIAPDNVIQSKPADRQVGQQLLRQFLAYQAPDIGTAPDLALRLAGLAHLLREAAAATLQTEGETGTLNGWRAAFEQTLLPNLAAAEFADMYAQTLTYGLFAAKVTVGAGQLLRRDTAAGLLPATNPFLQRLFYHLAGPEVPATVAWAIDDMVALLNATDWEAVLSDFGRGSLAKDPVVHFYETFLSAYDPDRRKLRGVYYTPEPVVSYIVRAVDQIVQQSFGRSQGLADPGTLILDPACGTGTFLHSVIALIYDRLYAQGQAGLWAGEQGYVSVNLLPRLFGFELLMAPYAMAHLKLGLALQERGYTFPPGRRLGVYLTNTLDEALKQSQVLPLAGFITEESNAAAAVKQDVPLEVILGNPPYAGHSANASRRRIVDPATGRLKTMTTWIGRLIEAYKQVAGRPLGEKNPKWLQDDYVKFLRWGQWRLDRTGRGVMAMITNHGYLDNPTFRGMRHSLLQTFDTIYLLNLHGNTKKREVAPDGSPDENVFDIQQGVAIGIFVKRGGRSDPARVFYADLWGLRQAKYQALAELALDTTSWQELQPAAPDYLFVPQALDRWAEYERGWPVNEIFPVNSVGIVTARDHLTIRWSAAEMWQTVEDFSRLTPEEAREKYDLGKDTRDWQVALAQKDLQSSGPDRRKVFPILYRPFDVRYTYYTGRSRGFLCMPRPEVMGHMLRPNIGLVCTRQQSRAQLWSLIGITDKITESSYLSTNTREINYIFPLYLYPPQIDYNNHKQNSFYSVEESTGYFGKQANFNDSFIHQISALLSLHFIPNGSGDLQTTFGPEDILSYAYAVFHAPGFRQRYAEFLKRDFPRLPLTSHPTLFAALVARGRELTALHLLAAPVLEKFLTRFPVSGSNMVDKVFYDENQHRVFFNPDQYFAGVPPEVWVFQVGGYQVCQKWLKDRQGRVLSVHDLICYQKIIVAIQETRRLMAEIDALIEAHGGWPLP